jgi:hypothetical protein
VADGGSTVGSSIGAEIVGSVGLDVAAGVPQAARNNASTMAAISPIDSRRQRNFFLFIFAVTPLAEIGARKA